MSLLAFHCDAESVRIGHPSGGRLAHRHVGGPDGSLADNALGGRSARGQVLGQSPDRSLTTIRRQRLGGVGLGRFLQQPDDIPRSRNQRMLHLGHVVAAFLLPADSVRAQTDNRGLKIRSGGLLGRCFLLAILANERVQRLC